EEARDIAATMGRDPGRATARLKGFKQGAELLAELWGELDTALQKRGAWTAAQRDFALKLLGIPKPMRETTDRLAPAPGQSEADALRALVDETLGERRELIAGPLSERDERDRSASEIDKGGRESPGVRLARRYLNQAMRNLTWGFGKINQVCAIHIDPK